MSKQPSRKRGNTSCGESSERECSEKKARVDSEPPRLSKEQAEYLGLELIDACKDGWTAKAEILIAEGAPVDYQNGFDYVPLHWASANGMTEIVMLLLKNKCNLNVTNDYEDTPLIVAAYNNNMDTVRALVEAGCDITIRGEESKTAAERAKEYGYHAIAEYINNHRFLPSARDESGQLRRVEGRAMRAMERDVLETGMLPAGPLSIIKEFATGKR